MSDTNYLTVENISTQEIIRIFSKIEINPAISWNDIPCWTWMAERNPDGYGRITMRRIRKTSQHVHRLIFAWLVHPLPIGTKHGEVDHLCRNRACCNPAHLDFVSHQENLSRGNSLPTLNSKKTHCLKGHELSADNLVKDKQHRRMCRTCKNQGQRERKFWRRPEQQEKARQRRLNSANH